MRIELISVYLWWNYNYACIVGTGGCVCFDAHQHYQGVLNGHGSVSDIVTGSISEVTITGLKPETSYEVKLSAVNGKGEGESSPAEFFKTEPVRKCLMLQVFTPLRPRCSQTYYLKRIYKISTEDQSFSPTAWTISPKLPAVSSQSASVFLQMVFCLQELTCFSI